MFVENNVHLFCPQRQCTVLIHCEADAENGCDCSVDVPFTDESCSLQSGCPYADHEACLVNT